MEGNYRKIMPDNQALSYMGRIDFEDERGPLFVYPCSFVRFVTNSKNAKIELQNIHGYFDNYIGILVDGECRGKELLQNEGITNLDLSAYMDGKEHEYTIYKRMDGCHEYVFMALYIDEAAELLKPAPNPVRKIEVYGDSVSAGEVSEAIDLVGSPDPENHNGVYSNSFYSYSWITARRLNAQLHDIAQGGIALLNGHGYFNMPDTIGMKSIYNKISYLPQYGPVKEWDFSKYIPQVVILAIGQNDNHPEDVMTQDYDGEQAQKWREEYLKFIRHLRKRYPLSHIILTTTILNHNDSWDRAIEDVAKTSHDSAVHHFLYSNNGKGTPGHIRKPEAEKMAEELSTYIDSLGIKW